MNKPVVAVFSDSNAFSIYLVENLLSKNCNVEVYAPDKKDWQKKTGHLSESISFRIIDKKTFTTETKIDYAVYCSGFLAQTNIYSEFTEAYNKCSLAKVKTIAIFPVELFNLEDNNRIPLNNNLSVVYLGDLFSPRMELEGNLRASRIIREMIQKSSVTAGIGEVFYPMFTPVVAKTISKWIFSFGPFGKEVFILGSETSASDIWKEGVRLLPEMKIHYDKNILIKTLPRGFSTDVIESNLMFILKETLKGVFLNIKKVSAPKIQRKKISTKAKAAIATVLIIFTLPIFMVLICALLLYSSFKAFSYGKADLAKSFLYLSKPISIIGEGESAILKNIPLVGLIYRETGYILYLGEKAADVGFSVIPAADAAKELMGKVLGNEIYDPAKLSNEISSSLEFIYQTVSIVQAETMNESKRGALSATKIKDKVNFEKIKKLAFSGSKISHDLPALLGKDQRETYLLLFQNNTELRPTGGFIGSFALVTFEGGRMTDFSVSDVYSADGQLKGHIEPPAPIKNYLGEGNWYLRDSNWDPDFPTSAKRAEWFIDKEVDRQVSGVVAIDLNPVKDILAYTGPIYLADYEMDITSENLYEKTQAEVHEDFFPGTHKKASFLTALSRNLVLLMGELNDFQKAGIFKTAYENFEERHIQTYLHNENLQRLFSELGWAGELRRPECKEGCFADFVGLVEANVGVNKANYFVTRDQKLEVETVEGRVKRTLNINFKNSANPNLGPAAKYKSYVRVYIPAEAEIQGNFDISEGRGIKEAGFLIEVLAGEEKVVSLTWSSQLDKNDYGIYIRKQAGTQEDDKLSVAIDKEVVYNSNLTKDIWIQKP